MAHYISVTIFGTREIHRKNRDSFLRAVEFGGLFVKAMQERWVEDKAMRIGKNGGGSAASTCTALLCCGRINLGFDNCPCDQPSGLSLMQCQLEIMTGEKVTPDRSGAHVPLRCAQSYECADHANARVGGIKKPDQRTSASNKPLNSLIILKGHDPEFH
jgi:hypothetical protein